MKKPNKYIIYLCIYLLIFPIISSVFGQEKQKSDVIFCPQCGKMNLATNKYCFSCETKLLKQKPSDEIPNIPPDTSQIYKTVSDSSINIKAKVLYDSGIALYETRNYKSALEEFNEIVRTYQSSEYYELALIMIKACQIKLNYTTTHKIPGLSYDSQKLMAYDKIIVILKNKQHYVLTNFAITDTHVVGIVVSRPMMDKSQPTEIFKIINLEDVALIENNPPSAHSKLYLKICGGCAVVYLIACIILYVSGELADD